MFSLYLSVILFIVLYLIQFFYYVSKQLKEPNYVLFAKNNRGIPINVMTLAAYITTIGL
jgi:hypothetical protein